MLYSVLVYTHVLLLNKFGLHAEQGDRFRIEFFLNGGSESVISALKILHVNIKTVLHMWASMPLHSSIMSLQSSLILNLMRIRIQLFSLMQIRIILPKILRIHPKFAALTFSNKTFLCKLGQIWKRNTGTRPCKNTSGEQFHVCN